MTSNPSNRRRVLTGITTTGTPHLGNYVGAIKPAIAASRDESFDSFYFLADYHALVKCFEPERIQRSTLEIAATWLALGLDTSRSIFYRQSDISEIPELTWLLTCATAKGLMNRSHAYKAHVAENEAAGEDPDYGINMGLFCYPILMAADILMFNAHSVPVGKDQIQHLEMARDIAARFNHRYGERFVMPEAATDEFVATLPGTDGRKMSKSYDNTIPLWLPEKKLRKAIMKIKTNSQEPGEPKDPDEASVYSVYAAFASKDQRAEMRQAFADGISWGEVKQQLFELVDAELAAPRERYEALINDPAKIEKELAQGAERARAIATPFIDELRHAVGIRRLA
ncbi:MAG: tryptophan--tRNA ligase [Pseudomonadota bacterium]